MVKKDEQQSSASVSTKIPFSDSVALKVIKAGTVSGADECGICGKSVNVENYPEGKKPVCKTCMKEIYEAVKEQGANF